MKDIHQLLHHQKLHDLIHHAASLRKLNAVLDAILPPALKSQVHCSRLEDGTLTLITASASFATQVRFSSGALLAGLKQQMPHLPIENLRCLVKPAVITVTTKPKKIERQISTDAATSILQAAATMSDEKLRKIWENLGSSYTSSHSNGRRKADR